MKVFLFTMFLFLNITLSDAQEKKVKLNVGTEFLKEVYIFNTDFKYFLNDKSFLSNGSAFSTKGESLDQPSFLITTTAFNHKVNDRLMFSFGHRYLENLTFKTSNSSISLRVTYKVIK